MHQITSQTCFCVGEGSMKLHCCVAAYVSDYAFLGTALLPYPNYRAKFSASLDHAMWFHSTFRSDEWMLYECESPWAGQCLLPPRVKTPPLCVIKQSFGCIIQARGLMCCPRCHTGGSRGLVQGRLWRRDGVLAASCSQEGVLRVKPVTVPSKL